MEVSPGYEQTEVGVIPADWNVTSMEDITSHIGDGLHGTPIYSPNGGYFFVNGNNLCGGKIVTTGETSVVDYSEFIKHRKPLSNRSILLSINGTIGNLAYYDDEPIVLGKSAAYLNIKQDVCREFIYHSLQSSVVRRQFFDGLTGSTIGNLGLATIRRTLIPFPSTVAEQRAIATALSDMDALLDGLTRLIAKKRDLKQATMQQLLTGKTRLPGFSGEWEVKTLGDVFVISAGKSKSAFISTNGDYWVVDMGSVSIAGRLIVTKRTNYHGDFLKAGDLVMPKDDIGGGNIIGKVGYIDSDNEYVLGDHVYCLRAKFGDSRFLAYVINSQPINRAIRKKVIGSAQLGLGRRSVSEQEIPFPDQAEQAAIATVLFDMDSELAALENRLTKTRALKQAMMSELLTGKTRLPT